MLTFQKHSTDSKLSTNTYLMSDVGFYWNTIQPQVVEHSLQFDIVYIWDIQI